MKVTWARERLPVRIPHQNRTFCQRAAHPKVPLRESGTWTLHAYIRWRMHTVFVGVEHLQADSSQQDKPRGDDLQS